MCCTPDISEILTNFTTVDIDRTNVRDIDDVYEFLRSKGVTCKKHLISGAPTSQIMSYLVNHSMFEEMQMLSNENNVTMTVYVDDVTFSSENYISYCFMKKIFVIVRKYGYKISKNKVKRYTKLYPKLVTGVVIDSSGRPTIKNSMRMKIISEYKNLKVHPEDDTSKNRLRGLLTAARQVDPDAFPNIYKFAFSYD